MTQSFPRIAFIGAGNMNGAVLRGAITSGIPADNITVSNPSLPKLEVLKQETGVHITQDNAEAVSQADIIVLGVKPQKMAGVCEALADNLPNLSNKLFVSVAVGITIARLEEVLRCDAAVVRVMPNTPSVLGFGASGLHANSRVNDQQKQQVQQLTDAVGQSFWLETEAEIDTISAISGSGPAYFFRFMEAMVEGAIKLGYDSQTARALVQQTAMGAAQMVKHNDQTSISDMRRQVTSPGGTTAEAIATFEQYDLDKIVDDAMQAAITRAGEIARSM